MGYDEGTITTRENLAAQKQGQIASHAATSATELYRNMLNNYNISDVYNAELADEQRAQVGQKANTERFQQMRKEQQAVTGVANSMGNALDGSGNQILGEMATERKDQDNVDYWQQYVDNMNAITNSQRESVNQNKLNRADMAANFRYQMQGMEEDLSAAYNNINPNLFVAPGQDGAYFWKPDVLYSDPDQTDLNPGRNGNLDMPDWRHDKAVSGYENAIGRDAWHRYTQKNKKDNTIQNQSGYNDSGY